MIKAVPFRIQPKRLAPEQQTIYTLHDKEIIVSSNIQYMRNCLERSLNEVLDEVDYMSIMSHSTQEMVEKINRH